MKRLQLESAALACKAGLAALVITASTLAFVPAAADELPVEVTPVVPGEIGPPPIPPPANPVVEIAICLDTSGSMDGLIESAKQKLWQIVNEFVFAEPMPRLRVALYTYGNDGHDPGVGWVRQETPLTENLDLVSDRLFAQTTNGGTELVGRVVRAATLELDWSDDPGAVKLIVVAGNETADQDRLHPFQESFAAAIAKDVGVHALFGGGASHPGAESWRQVARLSDGQFAAIDQQSGMIVLATPFDGDLTALSGELNGTYLAFGENGGWFCANQLRQDANALALNGEAAAARALTKANGLYDNSGWDLVDAVRIKGQVLAELPEEQLPEELSAMTPEQREAHVAELGKRRGELQERINRISEKRQRYLDEEMARRELDDSRSFDAALRRAIRGQAEGRGYRFGGAKPEAPATGPGVEYGPPPPPSLGATGTEG